MVTTDADHCVIDTNVLVYSTVEDSPWFEESRSWLGRLSKDGFVLCITNQIVREYLVILTRGRVFETVFSIDEALKELASVSASLRILTESQETPSILLDLLRKYQVAGKQVHDANIVATMISHNVQRLATYNKKDFVRFKEVELLTL